MDLLKKMKNKVTEKTEELVDNIKDLNIKEKTLDNTIRRFNHSNHKQVPQVDLLVDPGSSDSDNDTEPNASSYDNSWGGDRSKELTFVEKHQKPNGRKKSAQSKSLLVASVTLGGTVITEGENGPQNGQKRRPPPVRMQIQEAAGDESGEIAVESVVSMPHDTRERTSSVIGGMTKADAAMDDELRRAADMIRSIDVKRKHSGAERVPAASGIRIDNWGSGPDESPSPTLVSDPMLQAELQAQPLRTALAEFEGRSHVLVDGSDKVTSTSAFFDQIPDHTERSGLWGRCFAFGSRICPSKKTKSESYEAVALN